MQLGIVGLPFSGKSTLFQAVTRTHLDAAASAKPDAHIGIVKVPDERLDRCSALFTPKSTVHATIEFVDVAGLKKGASGTTQFATSFLSAVKNNDALIQVVRLFGNDAVPHPDGNIDPLRDVATFETEFILADMAVLESRIEKIHKQIGRMHDEQMKRELPVLEKCLALLHGENPLRNADLSPEELHVLKTYQLLSLKPMLIALSLDESQQPIMDDEVSRVAAAKAGLRTRVVAFFGRSTWRISVIMLRGLLALGAAVTAVSPPSAAVVWPPATFSPIAPTASDSVRATFSVYGGCGTTTSTVRNGLTVTTTVLFFDCFTGGPNPNDVVLISP